MESRYEENVVNMELLIPQEPSVTAVLRAGPSCDSCTVISGANDWILGNFIRVKFCTRSTLEDKTAKWSLTR